MGSKRTTVLAGIAADNASLFHRIRFIVSDSAVIIDFADGTSILIIRDIEMGRARQAASADRVCCAADFEPEGGLSGDRDSALAPATAECLRRAGETSITVDWTLPYLYAHFILKSGIAIEYSESFGVVERRIKTPVEVEHLRHAQKVTGEATTFACRTIANATADRNGILHQDGAILTSERIRAMITAFLIDRNFSNSHGSIVATAPHVLAQDVTHYPKSALYDAIKIWRKDGPATDGEFGKKDSWKAKLNTNNPGSDQEGKKISGVKELFTTRVFEDNTWGLQWSGDKSSSRGTFPQYYKQVGDERVVVEAKDVPEETGLVKQVFPLAKSGQPYTSPNTGA